MTFLLESVDFFYHKRYNAYIIMIKYRHIVKATPKTEDIKTYYSFERDLWFEKTNLTLELNHFTPEEKPVLSRGVVESPDSHRAISPSVFFTGSGFMMWYVGLAVDKDANYMSLTHSLCVAQSKDGINWNKPDINKKKNLFYNGNCRKLLLAGVDYISEKEKFVMAISFQNGNNGEGGQTVFGIAESKDGINWNLPVKPSIDVPHFEICSGVKKMNNCYWVIGQGISPYFRLPCGSPCGRTAFGFYSSNLKDWHLYPYPLFYYPPNEDFLKKNPSNSFQNHLGFTAWPRGRINLGLVGQFWPAGFSDNVRFTTGLIYSYDSLEWKEPFEKAQILAGEPGKTWFSNVIQGNTILNHGDKTYFWFSGGDDQGNTWQSHADIGLATIRRDGFSYFTGKDGEASKLVTKIITLGKGDECLYLNAAASPEHPIKIKLYDKFLTPMPGMEAVVTRDGVMERTSLDLSDALAKNNEVRLGFEWSGAENKNKLFGFCIGEKVDTKKYLRK